MEWHGGKGKDKRKTAINNENKLGGKDKEENKLEGERDKEEN